jgi:hypothetical protein
VIARDDERRVLIVRHLDTGRWVAPVYDARVTGGTPRPDGEETRPGCGS